MYNTFSSGYMTEVPIIYQWTVSIYRHERGTVPVEHSAYIANYLFKYKYEDFEIMKIINNVQCVKTVKFYAKPLAIIKKSYLIIDNACLFRKRFFPFFSV